MKPRELVQGWVGAFNRADVNALASFYSDDATNTRLPSHRLSVVPPFAKCFPMGFEEGEWAILEWRDPLGLRGCGFFHVVSDQIVFQRGYWDKLRFLRLHGLPLPEDS